VPGNEASMCMQLHTNNKYKLNQLTIGGVSCQLLPSLGRAFQRSQWVTEK